mmetsp:Transcript_59291/g.117502  ORF Transcript_59291/g.117502 Transcript_59291/m.117502 type:complete len:83 (+) Transcript_59291:326-574(+)
MKPQEQLNDHCSLNHHATLSVSPDCLPKTQLQATISTIFFDEAGFSSGPWPPAHPWTAITMHIFVVQGVGFSAAGATHGNVE